MRLFSHNDTGAVVEPSLDAWELLFIDNIFRFTQAGSEVSALLGRLPSGVGCQPTLADELSDEDRLVVHRARRVEQFLSQNLHVAEVYTNQPGTYVPVHETVRGFREILAGKQGGLPESAFHAVGTIDEAVAKRDEMLAVAA
ncbi:MAG: ATP synthase beta chain [uncultured Chloroflexi bacterium]|uniref:ATP synthase beta chain n=1 Tax=uncultured Chloroflexota bacterium TaxID=166587 RepID=A0A6J4HEK8_9CHLR|nr:MAG: ATP synthase beta chain [uncultured Chloroflexota bacterium]